MQRGIRPTQEKVRKALFDILGDIKGLSFLELFAGSGAIGIEALSREAKEVVFVEKEKRRCEIIRYYVSRLAGEPVSRLAGAPARQSRQTILNMDVRQAIISLFHKKQKFDIIFLDPPYYGDMVKKTLQTLVSYDILAPNGLIAAQHFEKDDFPDSVGDTVLFKRKKYGDTILSFYKKVK